MRRSTKHQWGPMNLTQETVIINDSGILDTEVASDTEEAGIIQFDCNFYEDDTSAPLPATAAAGPYEQLNPVFKEYCSLFEDNCTQEEINKIESILTNKIVSKRATISSSAGTHRVERFVSSNAESNKRLKSHGTKHMTYC
jgi:hypothetical protein